MTSWDDVLHALACFRSKGGKAVGTGFLIPGNRVLTCAHVVNLSLGRDIDVKTRPETVVQMSFLYSGVHAIVGHVLEWDRVQDYALLQITQPLDILPVKLLHQNMVDAAWGHQVKLVGYPEDSEQFATAQLSGGSSNKQWQLHKDDGPFVARGFSGAPVWNVHLKAVVGMLVSVKIGGQDLARCLSAAALADAMKELANALDVPASRRRAPLNSQKPTPPRTQDFDLRDQVDEILNSMKIRGLSGFGVACGNVNVLDNLRRRLEDELGAFALSFSPFQVNRITMSPEKVQNNIVNVVRQNGNHNDLVFVVYGLTRELEPFWRELKEVLVEQTLPRAVLVIFAWDDLVSLPLEIYQLKPLHFFKRGDVSKWVRAWVTVKGWEYDAIDFWQYTIERRCQHSEQLGDILLDTWLIYEHLEDTSRQMWNISSYDQWKWQLISWSSLNYEHTSSRH